MPLSSAGCCNLSHASHHSQVIGALQKTWSDMEGLTGSFDNASLIDAVRFAALCRRVRRAKGQKAFPPMSDRCVKQLQIGLAKILAAALNSHVRSIIENTPDIEERNIPSRKKRRSLPSQNVLAAGERPEARSNVKVDIDAIWELMEEARTTGLSLPVLMKTKKSEKQGGCSEFTVNYWMSKAHTMYCARACLSFDGVKILNLVTDSSTFSSREAAVSIVYSCERDLGAYCANQVVRTNVIAPGEIEVASEGLERLIATRKADRVASFRLLQAISHQISILTNHKLSINSFQLSDGGGGDDEDDVAHPLVTCLTPLTPQHLRIVNKFADGSFRSVSVLNKRTDSLRSRIYVYSNHCWLSAVVIKWCVMFLLSNGRNWLNQDTGIEGCDFDHQCGRRGKDLGAAHGPRTHWHGYE